MKLTWRIVKKRGNWRPVLTYHCAKEQWEIDLRVPGGETGIVIPVADPAVRDDACLPGKGERAESAQPHAKPLRLPANDQTEDTWEYKLPWRPGARPEYPEVEQAMKALMVEWEKRVQETLASGPLDISGEMEHSPEFKSLVAPYVAARRMLDS